MSGRQIVVIGGGLAGINAALSAADGGVHVVLVERRRHLGGLTWSFQRQGRWFDNGQHVFLRCCTEYLRFLGRIGASGQVQVQPRLSIPVLAPGGSGQPAVRADISRNRLPAPLHLAGALGRYRHLSLADRVRLGRPALALRRLALDDPALDQETFGHWLARYGQRPAAVERLWDLITLPTVNLPASQASLALAAKVFRTGLLDRADGADVGWATVPLGELHGANGLRALEQAGVEVRFGTSVERLASAGDGFTVQTGATGPTAGSERPLAADAVVVATPPEVAETLLPPGTIPPVGGLGRSPIVNVHLVLDRKVTDLPLAAAVDSPVQFVFDHTRAAGMDPSGPAQCLVVSLSAADAYLGRRPEDLIRSFHEALGDLFPLARRAELLDGVVSREHAATFCGAPGADALRPAATTTVPGLFVAGAWCATGWPATMEGAVRSGADAARATLSFLGNTPACQTAQLQEAPA